MLAALMASCSKEKSDEAIKEQPALEEANKPAAQETSAFDPIPLGADQETFEDKPGLVRATVKQGLIITETGNYLNGKREGSAVHVRPRERDGH